MRHLREAIRRLGAAAASRGLDPLGFATVSVSHSLPATGKLSSRAVLDGLPGAARLLASSSQQSLLPRIVLSSSSTVGSVELPPTAAAVSANLRGPQLPYVMDPLSQLGWEGLRPVTEAACPLLEPDFEEEEEGTETTVWADSVRRKRKHKMNKHKHRRRRKLNRHRR